MNLFNFNFEGSINSKLNTCCGSPAYAAPELLINKSYNGCEVDVWSIGIILFTLVSGYLPFQDEEINNILARIRKFDYTVPPNISLNLKSLIFRILEVEPSDRITIREILSHPWLKMDSELNAKMRKYRAYNNSMDIFAKENLIPEVIDKMRTFFHITTEKLITNLEMKKFDYMTSTYLLLKSQHEEGNYKFFLKFNI